MDAATLIGDTVVNSSGEDLGKIEAIMLDVTAGRIATRCRPSQAFWAWAPNILPFHFRVHLDAGEKRFILGVSKDRLEMHRGSTRIIGRRWPIPRGRQKCMPITTSHPTGTMISIPRATADRHRTN
jgi:hypothetical protein